MNNVYIHQLSAQAGWDPRSIFEQSLMGLNPEFSFFSTSGHIKVENYSLPYYVPIAGESIVLFKPFSRV